MRRPPRAWGRTESPPSSAAEVRYAALDGYFAAGAGQPHEIVERLFTSSADAVAALQRGDVQAVDRIGPAEAAALDGASEIVVEPTGPPTLHMLVPNFRRPLMSNPLFRRALAHAFDRTGIFNQQLTRGKPTAGNEVVDRLFGKSAAADATPGRIDPGFRYDPAAARLLVQFVLSSAAAPPAHSSTDKSSEAVATELVLALPPDDVARFACRAIQRDLQAAGIGVRLRELTSAAAPDLAADLTYIEWSALEPAAEFLKLIGGEGPGGNSDSDIEQLVHDYVAAGTADRAAELLATLDGAISERMLVLPLWRLTENLAYHRGLHGVGARPVTLYQNVEAWQLAE